MPRGPGPAHRHRQDGHLLGPVLPARQPRPAAPSWATSTRTSPGRRGTPVESVRQVRRRARSAPPTGTDRSSPSLRRSVRHFGASCSRRSSSSGCLPRHPLRRGPLRCSDPALHVCAVFTRPHRQQPASGRLPAPSGRPDGQPLPADGQDRRGPPTRRVGTAGHGPDLRLPRPAHAPGRGCSSRRSSSYAASSATGSWTAPCTRTSSTPSASTPAPTSCEQVPNRNESLDAESVEFLRLVNLYRVEHEAPLRAHRQPALVRQLAEAVHGAIAHAARPRASTSSCRGGRSPTERWHGSSSVTDRAAVPDAAHAPRNATTEQRLRPRAARPLPRPASTCRSSWHAPLRRLAEREASRPTTDA